MFLLALRQYCEFWVAFMKAGKPDEYEFTIEDVLDPQDIKVTFKKFT